LLLSEKWATNGCATNDYAYTEARRIAERTQRQMAALGFGA
jgi:hypothetical protein